MIAKAQNMIYKDFNFKTLIETTECKHFLITLFKDHIGEVQQSSFKAINYSKCDSEMLLYVLGRSSKYLAYKENRKFGKSGFLLLNIVFFSPSEKYIFLRSTK